MFLVIAFFFSEIFHIHKSRSLVKDGYGYVLKITDSLLLSFCTQGFARSCRIQLFLAVSILLTQEKGVRRMDEVYWNAGL